MTTRAPAVLKIPISSMFLARAILNEWHSLQKPAYQCTVKKTEFESICVVLPFQSMCCPKEPSFWLARLAQQTLSYIPFSIFWARQPVANANRKQSEFENGSLYDSIGHRLRTRQRCTPPIATE